MQVQQHGSICTYIEIEQQKNLIKKYTSGMVKQFPSNQDIKKILNQTTENYREKIGKKSVNG